MTCEEYKKLLEQETEPTPEQMDIMSEHAHSCAHCQAITLELETRILTSDFETLGEGEAFFNNFFSIGGIRNPLSRRKMGTT